VFLIGDDVWKVKRPVNFGFLDFRTVEARRRACELEVALNRRLAPDVYLGVDPVHATPAGPTLGGAGRPAPSGPVIDWAVHMRRLPDEAAARAMLGRGVLDAPALEVVAGVLARFFRDARPTPQFGTPEALATNVDENFAQVAPFVGELLERATLDQVWAFQSDELARKARRFAARAAEGRVREGHGDLRLEHVYFLPGAAGDDRRVAIIDCIEFNERFRCGDVAGDVAFLAMELEAARRPDLAAGFLARFAEASDDFGLYGVLDFYLSYRAWVRGKVAAFVTADGTASPELRRTKGEEARAQFALARSFSGAPLDRPFMIAVGGVIGSGKSTLAAGLGRALAAPVLASDRMRKREAGLAPTARGEAALYDRQHRDRTYAQLAQGAAEILETGRSVILDATFSQRRWRQLAAATARATNASYLFVEASCADRGVLRARLAGRRDGDSVSDARQDLLDAFLREHEPVTPADPGPRVTIDTGTTVDAALREAMQWLSASGVVAAADRRAS
jgi:aminoglycoside phosphotransferase family enzyme/predicted kinase